MKTQYLLAENTIDEGDVDDLIGWLKTHPRLTQGELVREFEDRWAQWLGTRHAVFVNSGSSANLLMYYTLLVSGRLRNRKVVVPAVSWATSVAPAIQLGFEPLMCDAEPRTYGLDPEMLEDLCRRHDPAAVLAVHVRGVPCELEALLDLSKRYDFVLMEDACSSTGSRYDDAYVGTFGVLSSFSLFFAHQISTIEGGMVCTDDRELYDLLLQLRSHGWAKELGPEREAAMAAEHGASEFNKAFTFYHPGFNFKSTDLNARIGLSQLKKLEHVINRRVENHKIYYDAVDQSAAFECQHNDRASICSIGFCVLAESEDHRAQVARTLTEAGVEIRPIAGGNMSRQPFWASRYGPHDFVNADRFAACSFQIPNHPAHSPDDIRHICKVLLGA